MLARFGGVGVVATAVHLGVSGLAFLLWPDISPFVANLVAFLFAFQVSYYGHRHFTFRRKGSAPRFFALALGGFAMNNGVLALLLELTPLDGFVTIVVATFTVPLLVYLAARFWAFA